MHTRVTREVHLRMQRLSFCNSRRSIFYGVFTIGETLSFLSRISRSNRVSFFLPRRNGGMLTFPRRKYANSIHLFYKLPATVLRSYKMIRAENVERYFRREIRECIYMYRSSRKTFGRLKRGDLDIPVRNIV